MEGLPLTSRHGSAKMSVVLPLLVVNLLFAAATSQAAMITQTFQSSWTIGVEDFYGDVSAWEWEYQPYTPWDSDLGTLTFVDVLLDLVGTREDAAETVQIRSSLFTGWDPIQYQYTQDKQISGGEEQFSAMWRKTYITPEAIAAVTHYKYFNGVYESGAGSGGAWYYFESRSENAAHTISATTTLSYFYDPVSVPEPNTFGLLLIGMAGVRLVQAGRVQR